MFVPLAAALPLQTACLEVFVCTANIHLECACLTKAGLSRHRDISSAEMRKKWNIILQLYLPAVPVKE